MSTLREQFSTVPRETLVPVGFVLDHLDDPPGALPATNGKVSWAERLWACPPETRLGVRELGEALGRGPHFVYRAVSQKWAAQRGREVLPHRRLDGHLVFEAGAVREWIQRFETIE